MLQPEQQDRRFVAFFDSDDFSVFVRTVARFFAIGTVVILARNVFDGATSWGKGKLVEKGLNPVLVNMASYGVQIAVAFGLWELSANE
jgi:hypothetical protein